MRTLTTLILGHMLWADTMHPPHPGWGVAVQDERIVAVASHADLRARFPQATVVEAQDGNISPMWPSGRTGLSVRPASIVS